ncbi:hypothetical protein LKM13_21475 [Bacillus anthracis]|uniref:hypothetical protein n=1 Tax=Bacillus anthracis TaxID=1392 RepID=UPI001D0F0773|nr:hypothetical protein [Bacillus anthracis]MCC2346627.1 hypothetical protein [Bacillus anthracis]
MKKKIIALTAPLLLAASLTTHAATPTEAEFNSLSTTPPSGIVDTTNKNDGFQRAKNPPGKKASVHNIDKNSYNFQVDKVGAQVYTDKWLKGKKTMTVDVENFTVTKFQGGTKNELYITLYNSKGKEVDSKTLYVNKASSVKFSGLDSSEKYFVKFSVPINGNTYSFNGSIE